MASAGTNCDSMLPLIPLVITEELSDRVPSSIKEAFSEPRTVRVPLSIKKMPDERLSEAFNHSVKADRDHARLFVRIPPGRARLEEARTIIEGLGAHIIETKNLSSGWVSFKLDVKDMREAALKLTEHGFLIKGINALSGTT